MPVGVVEAINDNISAASRQGPGRLCSLDHFTGTVSGGPSGPKRTAREALISEGFVVARWLQSRFEKGS